MTTATRPGGRIRAYGNFLFAFLYFFLARALAHHGAIGLASERWTPLVEQAMLVFLLLLGFAGLGFSFNRQINPVSAQGLPRRPGWRGEFGLGLAIGWGAVLVCVMVSAIAGGIAIRLFAAPTAWGWLVADTAYFALLTLGEEIAFRGYAFQRFAASVGSAGATLGFCLLYAFLQSFVTGATHSSLAVSFLLSLVLSIAYLRTRALWVGWGLNFGWKGVRALVFGLAVSGNAGHSPVIQGDPMGSFWLTGGGYGLEGSWFAFFVLIVILFVVIRATRDLEFRYNAPEIVAGGIPVDIDAAARRQHEAAMGAAAPPAPALVQIAPMTAPAPAVEPPAPPAAQDEPQ